MEKVSQGMDKNKEKISQETVKDGKSKKIVNDGLSQSKRGRRQT